MLNILWNKAAQIKIFRNRNIISITIEYLQLGAASSANPFHKWFHCVSLNEIFLQAQFTKLFAKSLAKCTQESICPLVLDEATVEDQYL